MRRVLAVVLAVLASIAFASEAHAGLVQGPKVGGHEENDNVQIAGFFAELEYQRSLRLPPAQRVFDYRRTSECLWQGASHAPCPQLNPGLPPLSLTCEDGAPVAPLWRTRIANPGAGWQMRADWSCPEDLLPPLTQDDLRRLKIEPLTVNQQPAQGPMLISKPVIVFAKPIEREFRVVLFGSYGVDVIVTPTEYTWEFGDGAALTTAEPGRPYPAFDVAHEYDEVGKAHITLTTAWSARYRVDADPLHRWRDADGTALTMHEGPEFEVIELRSTLVD